MATSQIDDLLTALSEPQLEAGLEVRPGTMRRMRREGRGPRWVRVGKLIRYPRAWVWEWLQKNEGGQK